MSEIDSKVAKMIQTWVALLVPEDPKERARIAKKTGLNTETLRKVRNRPNVSADTLFRLMLAQGISAKGTGRFPFTSAAFLDDSLIEWIKFGAKLSENERESLLEIAKIIQSRFS